MKILFVLVIASLLAFPVQAQVECGMPPGNPEGYVGLKNQTEIDNYQADYGGGGICDTIPGQFRISDALALDPNDPITNLDGLSDIVTIKDYFYLDHTSQLTTVAGMSSLEVVGGDFWFNGNTGMTALDGFTKLSHVGKRFFIGGHVPSEHENPGLLTVSFPSLVSVGNALVVYHNPDLTTVDLPNLRSVAGTSRHNNGSLEKVDIRWNQKLTDLSSLIPLLDGIDDGEPGPGDPNGPMPDVGGNRAVIGHNGEGANSAEEVINADFIFAVTKDFDDGNTAAVDVTLSCDGASPQTESLSENQTETLFIVRARKGSTPNCSVNVEELPGYTRRYGADGDSVHESDESGCHFFGLADNTESRCLIAHVVKPVEVMIHGDDSHHSALRLLCDADIEGESCDAPDGTQCVELTAPFTASVFPQFPNSHCWIEQANESDFYLDTGCDALHPMVISAGVGASCIATFTDEPVEPPVELVTPIPALSYIWIAVLSLLVLAVVAQKRASTRFVINRK